MQHSACTRVCGRNTPTAATRAAWPRGTSAWHAVWCGTACSAATAQRSPLGLWGHVCAGEDRYIKPLQAPRQSPAGHDPYLRGLPVAYRAGRHAGRPALTATQARQLAALREKICGVPGAWYRAGAPKQHAAGVYRQIILHNSRKIYICALQTAPQWAIIDLNRTAELPRQG